MSGKRNSNRKKAAAASIGILAGVAIFISSLIPQASDIVAPGEINEPPPIVLHFDGDDVEPIEQASQEGRKSARFADRIRKWILGIPAEVRTALILPLWVFGAFVSQALSTIGIGLLSPAAGFLLSWLITAAALAGTFAFGAKLLFPNIPFRKIFNKNRLAGVMIAALVIASIDAALPFVKPEYVHASKLMKAAGSFVFIAVLISRFKKKNSAISP